MLIGIVIASMGAIVMHAPEAYADDCKPVPIPGTNPPRVKLLCGAVKNRTGRVIHITFNLRENPNDSTPHRCAVWNWDGGPGGSYRNAACLQETRGNGFFGGNDTGHDVDAFTFANHGYHVRHSRVGRWHWEIQGIWTKIRDGEVADCGIGDNNKVWCTLLFQAP